MTETQMRRGFATGLADYGAINSEVVVLDPDTSASTMSKIFAQRFPERFFNVGITEPTMVDIAVGLALGGKVPFACGFAALISLRALEQIRTCVCYAQQNVKLAASYAGLSDYKDGPTHHAITDIAIMRAMPNMTVIVPADAAEAYAFVPLIAELDRPVYLRINRSETIGVHDLAVPLEIGKGITRRNGSDATIVATGSMVGRSLRAAERLAQERIEARVIEIHTVKPLDAGLVCQAASETGALVTVEEHSIIGGLAGAVTEALGDCKPVPVERVGVQDTFMRTDTDPESLLNHSGLSIEQIAAATRRVLMRR